MNNRACDTIISDGLHIWDLTQTAVLAVRLITVPWGVIQSPVNDPKSLVQFFGPVEDVRRESLNILWVKCLVWRAGNYSLVYALNKAFWEVGEGGSWVRCQKQRLKITPSSRPALHPTATPGDVRHESALLCWPTGFLAQRILLTSPKQQEYHLPLLSQKHPHMSCYLVTV